VFGRIDPATDIVHERSPPVHRDPFQKGNFGQHARIRVVECEIYAEQVPHPGHEEVGGEEGAPQFKSPAESKKLRNPNRKGEICEAAHRSVCNRQILNLRNNRTYSSLSVTRERRTENGKKNIVE